MPWGPRSLGSPVWLLESDSALASSCVGTGLLGEREWRQHRAWGVLARLREAAGTGSRGRAESCRLTGCSERQAGAGALAAREEVGAWGGALRWQAWGLLPPLLRLVALEGVRLRGRLAQWCGALVALAA